MQYMMMIYSQERPDGLPPDEVDAVVKAHVAVMNDSSEKGVLRGVERLKPTSAATTVRMKDGTSIIMDGPFAETKEQLAGYYILDCESLEEALDWAKRIPTGCRGSEGCIEIRPIEELNRRPG